MLFLLHRTSVVLSQAQFAEAVANSGTGSVRGQHDGVIARIILSRLEARNAVSRDAHAPGEETLGFEKRKAAHMTILWDKGGRFALALMGPARPRFP
jgi:hypothetical protein